MIAAEPWAVGTESDPAKPGNSSLLDSSCGGAFLPTCFLMLPMDSGSRLEMLCQMLGNAQMRKARVSAQHAAVCFLLIAGQEDQEQCQVRLLSSGMKSRWCDNGEAGFSRMSLKMLLHCEIQG